MSSGPLASSPGVRPESISSQPSLAVTEIFHSIQGESSFAGWPCVFVRLTACNLRCRWCDTEYAFHEGERMALEEVLRRVDDFPSSLVEVTGGEPLLQPASLELMRRLADRGRRVLLETGGHMDISAVDPRVVRIVDIKCPGSGESHRNRWENLDLLLDTDEVKLVVAGRDDFDWAAEIVRTRLQRFRGPIHFSAVHGELAPVELAGWLLASGLKARMQLQLHKYIWSPEARGV